MKSPHCSSLLKGALLIVLLALCLGGSTVAQAGGKDPLSPGPVRPGNLDYRTELPFFKNVKNQRFPADEIPEVVALPVGTYAVIARSERDGYGRVLVVIKEGQQTIVDLDLWEKKTRRLAHN
jgi:hypothetical protein